MAKGFFSLERSLRSIHSWLGVLILPWVIILGLTGLYLNHAGLVKSVLPNTQKADLSVIDLWPNPQPVDNVMAVKLAGQVWPNLSTMALSEGKYRRQPVINVETDRGTLSVVKKSGHYWVRGDWQRSFFAPDGTELARYMAWGGLFKRLHKYGLTTKGFGTWLADIAAVALVVFGFTGLVLFINPRLRRRKNRRARSAHLKTVQAQAQTRTSIVGSEATS